MKSFWAMAEHVVLTLGALWALFKWLLRKHDQAIEQDAFIKELRENHLPHIFKALQAICKKLDINLEDLNG